MISRRYSGYLLLLVASASAFCPLSTNLSVKSSCPIINNDKNLVLFSSSDEDLLSGSSSSLPKSSGSSRTNSAFAMNEFSRILHIDRVFQQKRRNASGSTQQRDHDVRVNADAEECKALAKRFDLKGLTRLEANLSFRPSSEALGAGTGGSLPVEVEGSIEAHLTQTCVRTNEEFEIDVEFPIYAVVKPVASNNDEDLRRLFLQQQEEEEQMNSNGGKKNKKKKKKKDDVFHENKKTYNLADVFDLQAAIQEADFFGDDDGGAADLVEDEAIYSLSSEQLDVGELVAQTFWLQLDPYPKKPGSDPVSWEITG